MSDAHLAESLRITAFAGDGSIKTFPIPFPVWDETGVGVFISGVFISPSAYTLQLLGEIGGAQITFFEAPVKGSKIVIAGTTARERKVDYNEYATLKAVSMNLDENYQEVQIQENTRDIFRSLKTPLSDGVPDYSMEIPPADERANGYLAFDDEGKPIIYGKAGGYVHGLPDGGSTANDIMVWADNTGLQAADSGRQFGAPNGAATLDGSGRLALAELPQFSVTPLGQGVDVVSGFFGQTNIRARRVSAGTGAIVTEGADGSVKISLDNTYLMYYYTFTVATWGTQRQIVISSDSHGLGANDRVLATVRDSDGNEVECNVNVSSTGTVTLCTDKPFSGSVRLYGSYSASAAGLPNPMDATGDIIYSVDRFGTPTRLGIGEEGNVLGVSEDGIPQWTQLGTASLLDAGVPNGVPVMDRDGLILATNLPFNTMTYKGTFGVDNDLPDAGSLDGDIWICNSDEPYHSAVAGKTFGPGEWAVYNGAEWDVLPTNSDPSKAQKDASNLSDDDAFSWGDRLVSSSLVQNGYAKIGSLRIQWGEGSGSPIPFPVAFPTACLNVSITSMENGSRVPNLLAKNQTNFSYILRSNTSSTGLISWQAIGY
jgi:hypothetical protein